MAAVEKPIWRRIGVAVGVFLLILLGIAQLFKKDLVRLQFVLTLFEPHAIVANFRGMTRLLDHRTVRRSGLTYRMPYAGSDLPQTYRYNGRHHDLAHWISRTATSGLIVVHNENIAYERYYLGNSARTHWISWSLSNAIVSALVGFAMHEGLIRSTSDLVTDYLPWLKDSGYHGVTLKDVLQMSSGVAFDENYADFTSDINRLRWSLALGTRMDDVIASLGRIRPPGAFKPVPGMDAQVLAMVLREATGRSLTAYMEEKLWSRLGAEADAFWLVDANGMELAFGGLNAILRDYARFGLLYLHEGKNFRGQQILPGRWIRASTRPDPYHHKATGLSPDASQPLGHGYHWWLPGHAGGDYCAIGIYGQFIYVHPRYQVVIAKTSAYADYNNSGKEMERESLAVFRAIAAHMDQNP